MRALIGLVVIGLTALTAGLVGFQAGIASNIGAAGGAVYLGGGFPGFGFLFFLLFVGFLFFAAAGRRRGPWGMRGGRMHHAPWGGDMDSGDPRRQWIADAHRRLHEEEARSAAGQTPAAGADPFDPTPPAAG